MSPSFAGMMIDPGKYLVFDPLSGIDILRLSSSFLSSGLILSSYLQYTGEIIKLQRKEHPDWGEPYSLDSYVALPFGVGLFFCPIGGYIIDKCCGAKSVFTVGTLVAILGMFMMSQYPCYATAVLLFIGYHIAKTAGYALIWNNCQANGRDSYGKGYAAATFIEGVGLYLGLLTSNVSWAQSYTPKSMQCKDFCVDLRFVFQLVIPVITLLCLSLVCLSRSPTIRFPKVTAPTTNGTSHSSSSSSPRRMANNGLPLAPKSGSGARLTCFLYFATWCAWGALLLKGSLYFTRELYTEYDIFREDLRIFGNALYRLQIDATSHSISQLQQSYIFSNTVWSFFFVSSIIMSLILFVTNYADNYVVARLYDVGNNLLCANLLVMFLFLFYPYKKLVFSWAIILGVGFSVQQIMPFLMVNRYIVSSPASLQDKLCGRFLGAMQFAQCFGCYCVLYFLPTIYSWTQTWSGIFVILAGIVFFANLLTVRPLSKKEEELSLLMKNVPVGPGE